VVLAQDLLQVAFISVFQQHRDRSAALDAAAALKNPPFVRALFSCGGLFHPYGLAGRGLCNAMNLLNATREQAVFGTFDTV
jgi:hypothetical protein